jgi:hypothetical protein
MRSVIALILLTLVGVGVAAAPAVACPYSASYNGS